MKIEPLFFHTDIQETNFISKGRIHVETATERLKEVKIFHGNIPLTSRESLYVNRCLNLLLLLAKREVLSAVICSGHSFAGSYIIADNTTAKEHL